MGQLEEKSINGVNENTSTTSAYAPPVPRATIDILKILKGISTMLGILVVLGGLVWGAAMLFAGTASDDDIKVLETRINLVEKNDIEQTVLLRGIQSTLDKMEIKLEEALKK